MCDEVIVGREADSDDEFAGAAPVRRCRRRDAVSVDHQWRRWHGGGRIGHRRIVVAKVRLWNGRLIDERRRIGNRWIGDGTIGGGDARERDHRREQRNAKEQHFA